MCGECGCDGHESATLVNLRTGAKHEFPRAHDHSHEHGHGFGDGGQDRGQVVALETRILAKNDALAARNRAWLQTHGVLALNVMSAPGAGKTTLLERTIDDLAAEMPFSVMEGDQATAHDAERIARKGAPVVQINTGAGCHLEAEMVAQGLSELSPPRGAVLIIENVGNLVCPALFDLGEQTRVAILSVTEGEDKPVKYPHMFRAADLLLLNKIDLLPYLDFDMARACAYAREVNPGIEILALSARSGEGMDKWYGWLRAARYGATLQYGSE